MTRVFRGVGLAVLAAGAAVAGSFPAAGAAVDGTMQQMVTVVHLHSSLADGAGTPADLARAARRAGVDAIVVTDHLLERVAWAPWPIGNVLGVALSRRSVISGGVDRYLEALAAAERAVPGTLVIPGVEVTPFARWRGSAVAGTLELRDWHRHALVAGIDDARALARLPIAGNRRGGVYGAWSLGYVAAAGVLAWSFRRLARPARQEVRLGAFRIRRRRLPLAAALAGAIALAVLIAGFPWRVERFSAVAAIDPRGAPLETFIAAVKRSGGVVTWAHPEAAAREEVHGIPATTDPYPEIVRATSAEAFAALPEGTESLLPPGGIWDGALIDHLEGRRAAPLFALAEMDEHRAASQIDFGTLQTVFLVPAKTRAHLLDAWRGGRFYARRAAAGGEPLRLTEWRLEAGSPAAAVRFALDGGGGGAFTARVIRSGRVIWSQRVTPPFAARVEDAGPRPAYYRLDVEGAYPWRLLANPLFVERSPA